MTQPMDILDLCRGFMAVFIVISHISTLFFDFDLSTPARIIVVFFMCLSGYGLSCGVAKYYSNGNFDVLRFSLARLKKILIPTIGVLIGIYVLRELFEFLHLSDNNGNISFAKNPIKQLTSVLTLGLYGSISGDEMTQFSSNGALWFLTALIRCYAVFSWVNWVRSKNLAPAIRCAAILFLCFFVYRSFRLHFPSRLVPTLDVYMLCYLSFGLGCLVAKYREFILRFKKEASVFAAFIFVMPMLFIRFGTDTNTEIGLVLQCIIAVAIALVLPILSTVRIKDIGGLRHLEAASYWIYLIHQPINVVFGILYYHFNFTDNSKPVFAVMVLVISVVVAIAIQTFSDHNKMLSKFFKNVTIPAPQNIR